MLAASLPVVAGCGGVPTGSAEPGSASVVQQLDSSCSGEPDGSALAGWARQHPTVLATVDPAGVVERANDVTGPTIVTEFRVKDAKSLAGQDSPDAVWALGGRVDDEAVQMADPILFTGPDGRVLLLLSGERLADGRSLVIGSFPVVGGDRVALGVGCSNGQGLSTSNEDVGIRQFDGLAWHEETAHLVTGLETFESLLLGR